MSNALDNYVNKFQGMTSISSVEYVRIFKSFDKNGNGYIESNELDNLLKEIAAGILKKCPAPEDIDIIKKQVMSSYDVNQDGRIEMDELAMVLPTEENFLIAFRSIIKLSSVNFMQIWLHYDRDRSGYIEPNELEGFLVDLMKRDGQGTHMEALNSYTNAMKEMFDTNKDGKISLHEMAKILPVEDNAFKALGKSVSESQFNQIWAKYDADGNGFIMEVELLALLKDAVSLHKTVDDVMAEVEKFKGSYMKMFDKNKDGKISKDELRLMLQAK